MYKEFFHFKAEPFRVTPDPGFLFLTDQHREALAAIIYGIAKRKGFVCITGEVGVGKTTILRSYLDSVDEPALRFVYVYHPNVSFLTLLKHIFKELGLTPPGEDIAAMVDALRAWLVEGHRARHQTLVLMIDEAQNMPIGTLESLRQLSNLETATEKLVQIVLVGQPELDALLAERQLRQLESRIAVRTRLGPLTRADSLAYMHHRLKCVALDDVPAFTDGALALIVRRAHGIPRRINVLCDNALMAGFTRKTRPVTRAIVAEVLRDMRVDPAPKVGWFAGLPWRGLAAVGGAVAIGGAVLTAGLSLRGPDEQVAGQVVAAPVPPPPIPQAAPDAPPLPAAVESLPPPPPPPLPQIADLPAGERRVLRIVAPGDTLAGLTSQVYGAFDSRSLDWVKRNNPDITDVDRIQVGQVIEFPPMPGK
ncbi:MAG: AAA family ATPase [Magnetospirillum sp.]|nr:AAA family ATPase [Magnetospirillum sp.]